MSSAPKLAITDGRKCFCRDASPLDDKCHMNVKYMFGVDGEHLDEDTCW